MTPEDQSKLNSILPKLGPPQDYIERQGEPVEKSINDRMHVCTSCGLKLDRDHNAAINILNRAEWRPADANQEIRLRPVLGCLENTSQVETAHGDESPVILRKYDSARTFPLSNHHQPEYS